MMKKLLVAGMTLSLSALLVACGGDKVEDEDSNNQNEEHMEMDHSSSGEIPEKLKEADNPKFPIGSKAEITTDHMPGMKGAVAVVEGAFDTTVYIVSYEPTTGGEMVNDHKWVIHEEIKDAPTEAYQKGDEVVLEADHMEGMKGATATIDEAQQTTVYMVSYEDTETGKKVSNHKWVTEEELSVVQ